MTVLLGSRHTRRGVCEEGGAACITMGVGFVNIACAYIILGADMHTTRESLLTWVDKLRGL